MKTFLIASGSLLAACWPLALHSRAATTQPVPEAVAALGMLPTQRDGLRISPQERNPFAVKPHEIIKSPDPVDAETQESKIRSIFNQLRVTGTRRDRDGRSLALAGDLILRQGEEVKPVLEDQTEVLIVSKIGPRQIELTFVENKDSTQPRIIILPVRNQVEVAQKLFAQPQGRTGGFYIARGRTPVETAEAAGALAASPPTAPATTRPSLAPPATTAIAPRDARREAAALAGLSESAMQAFIETNTSLENLTPATPAAALASPPTHLRRRQLPPDPDAAAAAPSALEH